MKEKELVTLRQKPMRNGGFSLFLDYAIDGVRNKEYLKMYLVPDKGNKLLRKQNEETLKTAQALKAKRVLELQDRRAGLRPRTSRDILLTDYIQKVADDYKERGHTEFAHTLEKIKRLAGDYKRVSMHNLTKEYVLGFVKYMRDKGLSDSTIHVYYCNLNTLLNFAYREDIIVENPMQRIDKTLRPRRVEATREYLTREELERLMATPMPNDVVRRAFLFSCFTGLRLSDVENLTWENIKPSEAGWQVEERQMKTKNIVVIPLSENAMSVLPPRGKPKQKVWSDLPSRTQIGKHIKKWVESAGIEKHITFHCARHTNATLLLTYGVDIYTVSTLLGHKDVATTQVYAKVISEKKVKAVNMIPLLSPSGEK